MRPKSHVARPLRLHDEHVPCTGVKIRDMFSTLDIQAIRLVQSAVQSLWVALQLLFFSAVWFCGLALLVKGKKAIDAGRRAIHEARLNISILTVDVLFVAPSLAVLVKLVRVAVDQLSLPMFHGTSLDLLGRGGILVAVVFIGDFISYWRHRLEHTRMLWPAHAIHHSDREVTWLTLARFHPIDRLVTGIFDITFLALLGFPDWALVGNEIVRHYYGEFIHADLPFTYGVVGRLFVSPAMHRWHHARDVTGAGSNFATVFSVFDQAFGTYHLPGICNVPLGVNDDIGPGFLGQLRFPFTSWIRAYRGDQLTEGAGSPERI
jgi:sterol desaturase/sphingolipid hydroxylase (fatty acid hydroxylase superfamily)